MRILVKLGARNEAENLPTVFAGVAALREELDFDILLLDDGSTDATGRIMDATGLPVIRFPECRGISAGHREALRYALERGYDACVTLDGDGQHDPVHLREVIGHLRQGAAFVQCSRYHNPVEYRRAPLDRRMLQDAVIGMLRRYVGWEPLTDALCGFWGMHRPLIERLLPQLNLEGYGFQIELLLRMWYLDPRPERIEVLHPAVYRNGTRRLDDLYTDDRLAERARRFGIHAEHIWRIVRDMNLG